MAKFLVVDEGEGKPVKLFNANNVKLIELGEGTQKSEEGASALQGLFWVIMLLLLFWFITGGYESLK